MACSSRDAALAAPETLKIEIKNTLEIAQACHCVFEADGIGHGFDGPNFPIALSDPIARGRNANPLH
jgi:hypothetical protein